MITERILESARSDRSISGSASSTVGATNCLVIVLCIVFTSLMAIALAFHRRCVAPSLLSGIVRSAQLKAIAVLDGNGSTGLVKAEWLVAERRKLPSDLSLRSAAVYSTRLLRYSSTLPPRNNNAEPTVVVCTVIGWQN